jgi:hypothetical protein
MSKHKLKLVEPSLQDQLDAAIVVATSAHETLKSAEAEFRKRYPDDHRLLMGEVLGMTLVDAERDFRDPNAPVQSKRVEFLKERENVSDLQRDVREADGAVELLRTRIEAAVTEEERRAALAAAIEDADKADAALRNLHAIVARADSAVADAQERHSDAARAVTVATETHARLFEAAIEQGHAPGQDSSVRDARRAADDAADDLAVAKAAATAMRAKLGNAERRLGDTQKAVTSCAQNVVLAALPKLLAEAQTMQRELEARRVVPRMLGRFEDGRSEVDEFLEATVFPYFYNGGRPEDHPAVTPWLEGIEALQTDADAPLPAN